MTAQRFFTSDNRDLAHDVVAYAERCAAAALGGEDIAAIHACWQPGYLEDEHGVDHAVNCLIAGREEFPAACFLSLVDNEQIVAMRFILALAGVSLRSVQRGLEDDHFPPLTTAMSRFCRSRLQLAATSRTAWPDTAMEIIKVCRPALLVVDGIGFRSKSDHFSSLSTASALIDHARNAGSALLLFD